jgi:hypothetical protein
MSKNKFALFNALKALSAANDITVLNEQFEPVLKRVEGVVVEQPSQYVELVQDPSNYVELVCLAAKCGHLQSLKFWLADERQLKVLSADAKHAIILSSIDSTPCTLGVILGYLYGVKEMKPIELFEKYILNAIDSGNAESVEILLDRTPDVDLHKELPLGNIVRSVGSGPISILNLAIERACKNAIGVEVLKKILEIASPDITRENILHAGESYYRIKNPESRNTICYYFPDSSYGGRRIEALFNPHGINTLTLLITAGGPITYISEVHNAKINDHVKEAIAEGTKERNFVNARLGNFESINKACRGEIIRMINKEQVVIESKAGEFKGESKSQEKLTLTSEHFKLLTEENAVIDHLIDITKEPKVAKIISGYVSKVHEMVASDLENNPVRTAYSLRTKLESAEKQLEVYKKAYGELVSEKSSSASSSSSSRSALAPTERQVVGPHSERAVAGAGAPTREH